MLSSAHAGQAFLLLTSCLEDAAAFHPSFEESAGAAGTRNARSKKACRNKAEVERLNLHARGTGLEDRAIRNCGAVYKKTSMNSIFTKHIMSLAFSSMAGYAVILWPLSCRIPLIPPWYRTSIPCLRNPFLRRRLPIHLRNPYRLRRFRRRQHRCRLHQFRRRNRSLFLR